MKWSYVLSLAFTLLSFSGCAVFTSLYARWYPFWRSEAGLNLFLFTFGLGALDGIFFLGQLYHSDWVKVVALVIYAPQPVVIWWRVALLIRTRRGDRGEGDPES